MSIVLHTPPACEAEEAAEATVSEEAEAAHAVLEDCVREHVDQCARSLVTAIAETVNGARVALDKFEEAALGCVQAIEEARNAAAPSHEMLVTLGDKVQALLAQHKHMFSPEAVTVQPGRPWTAITKQMVHEVLNENKAYVFTALCPGLQTEHARPATVSITPLVDFYLEAGHEFPDTITWPESRWLDGPRPDCAITVSGARPDTVYLAPCPVSKFLGLADIQARVEAMLADDLRSDAEPPTFVVNCWVVDRETVLGSHK